MSIDLMKIENETEKEIYHAHINLKPSITCQKLGVTGNTEPGENMSILRK